MLRLFKRAATGDHLRPITTRPTDPWIHFEVGDKDFCDDSGWIIGHLDYLQRQKGFQGVPTPSLLEPTGALYGLLSSGRTEGLQEFTRCLSEHVGLTPVPTTAYDWDVEMEVNTAGQARLDRLSPVIRVGLRYTSRPRELAAILAHEVTHHYLDSAQIRLADTNENEKLTDLACVFLGLVKLLLNGVDIRYDTSKAAPADQPTRLGYLAIDALACAFDKVCCLNVIPTGHWLTNLFPEASYYLQGRANAREPSMGQYLRSKQQYDKEVTELTGTAQEVLAHCKKMVQSLASDHDSFLLGIASVNANYRSLRIGRRDGSLLVRANGEMDSMRQAVCRAKSLLWNMESLCAALQSDPDVADNVKRLDATRRELQSVTDVELRRLRSYLHMMRRYTNDKRESVSE
jgi:hypothetical protein